MELWNKQNYFNPILPYVKDKYIHEWDLRSAHYNILRTKNMMSKKDTEFLSSLNKTDRNIEIGLLQKRRPDIATILNDELKNMIRMFICDNNINEMKILSIKKDAVTVIDTPIKCTKYGDFLEFIKKASFTSYLRIERYEFFTNGITGETDIKGFGQNTKINDIHNLIFGIMKKLEGSSKDDKFELLQKLQRDYLELKLDPKYYKNIFLNQYILEEQDIKSDRLICDLDQLDISENYIKFILPMIKTII